MLSAYLRVGKRRKPTFFTRVLPKGHTNFLGSKSPILFTASFIGCKIFMYIVLI
jgi:hypothetical protein